MAEVAHQASAIAVVKPVVERATGHLGMETVAGVVWMPLTLPHERLADGTEGTSHIVQLAVQRITEAIQADAHGQDGNRHHQHEFGGDNRTVLAAPQTPNCSHETFL